MPHAEPLPTRLTSRGGVERRRAAVAHARTLDELVAAHDGPGAFLATPYGAALVAHRVEVLGHSRADALAEIGA